MSILDPENGTVGAEQADDLDMDSLKAEVERLRAENEALSKGKSKGNGIPVRVEANGVVKEYTLSMKVGDKGTVVISGMSRFPVSQYAVQWLAVLGIAEQVKGFIRENADKLSWQKPVKPTAETA